MILVDENERSQLFRASEWLSGISLIAGFDPGPTRWRERTYSNGIL